MAHNLETLVKGGTVVLCGVATVEEVCYYGMHAAVGKMASPSLLQNFYTPVDIG